MTDTEALFACAVLATLLLVAALLAWLRNDMKISCVRVDAADLHDVLGSRLLRLAESINVPLYNENIWCTVATEDGRPIAVHIWEKPGPCLLSWCTCVLSTRRGRKIGTALWRESLMFSGATRVDVTVINAASYAMIQGLREEFSAVAFDVCDARSSEE